MREYAVTAALVGVLALANTSVAGQVGADVVDAADKNVTCSNQGGAQHHKVICVNVTPNVVVDIDVSRSLNGNEIKVLEVELRKLDFDVDAMLLVVKIERTVVAVLSRFGIVVSPDQIRTCVGIVCG